jgi:hypothetical protein
MSKEWGPLAGLIGEWQGQGGLDSSYSHSRGISVLAGGRTTADATEFSMSAELGSKTYAIGENTYLGQHASTVAYSVTVTVNGPDSWSYSENTSLRMDQFPDILPHTDGNTLHRVG